jgi:hypothetical protein
MYLVLVLYKLRFSAWQLRSITAAATAQPTSLWINTPSLLL